MDAVEVFQRESTSEFIDLVYVGPGQHDISEPLEVVAFVQRGVLALDRLLVSRINHLHYVSLDIVQLLGKVPKDRVPVCV